MLNFKAASWIFVVVVACVMLLDRYNYASWWMYALPLLIYVSLLVWGAMNIQALFFLRAICKADTNEKTIAITFDDGPHPVFTSKVLEILKRENIKSTFFCIGKNMEQNENLLKDIVSEGHIIGNHSYSHHFWFDMFPSKKMIADVKQANDVAEKITGKKMLLFRPPYGVTNPAVAKTVKELNLTSIGWSVRSLDTTVDDKGKLLKRVTENLNNGDVLLFHESGKHTVEMLPQIIRTIKEKGFEIVALDNLLNVKVYA